MKFTIITATFNSEKTIRATLDSIICQTYQNFECIIVDGASTDKTFSIVQEYLSDSRFRFGSEEDKGIFDAMNKGIGRATVDVLYFLNSDDSFINKQVLTGVAKSFESQNIDSVCGKVLPINLPKFQAPGFMDAFYSSFKSGKELLIQGMCHQRLFIRKSCFEQFGLFDLNYPISADVIWFIKAVYGGIRICFSEEVIAEYNCLGRSRNARWQLFREKFYFSILNVPVKDVFLYLCNLVYVRIRSFCNRGFSRV